MTTIFVPMSKGQADWSFLNRQEAFRRGFDTASDGSLSGFRDRQEAIAAEKEKHIAPFALLRISFDATTHEALAYNGHLRADSGRWIVSPTGLEQLASSAEMLMEVLPGQYKLSEMQRVDPFDLPATGGPTGFLGC